MTNQNDILQGRNIWMYWPGEYAELFDENFEKGELTCEPLKGIFNDLTPFLKNPYGFEYEWRQRYGACSRYSKNLLFDLCFGIKVGDFILARSSVRAIVGIGIITGDYYYDNNRTSCNHCRPVKWLARGCWSFDGFQKAGWNRVTLVKEQNRQTAEQLITRVITREYGFKLPSVAAELSQNNPGNENLDSYGSTGDIGGQVDMRNQSDSGKLADPNNRLDTNIQSHTSLQWDKSLQSDTSKQVDTNTQSDIGKQSDNGSALVTNKSLDTSKQADTSESADNSNLAHNGKGDSAFKAQARQHQREWMGKLAQSLGVESIIEQDQDKAVLLTDDYALQGFIFCPLFRKDVIKLYKDGRININMPMLKNALRSEHIPYNLFFPMLKPENWNKVTRFLNELLHTNTIAEALDMDIEFSPEPKAEYLNDHTAFDVYIKYRHIDGSLGGIGIEVKYTEEAYSLRRESKEYKCTHDNYGNVCLRHHYRKATDGSGYYLKGTNNALVSDTLRQVWRNHILGSSMVVKGDLTHFTSLTLYPKGNVHFEEVEKMYRQLLSPKGNDSFKMVTFEEFFSVLTNHFHDEQCIKWISYLYDRYLFDSQPPVLLKDMDYNDRFEETTEYYILSNDKPSQEESGHIVRTTKSLNRGLRRSFIEAFKRSPLYQLFLDHQDELIICVRPDYINLYYRRNSIAKVSLNAYGEIKVEIDRYFLEIDENKTGKTISLEGEQIREQIIDRYDRIQYLTQNKKDNTPEMVTQHMLYMQNNSNPDSKWFCVDMEWTRSFSCVEEKVRSGLSAKMDMIAITKTRPHHVAIIELKYGSNALSGDSGVKKHIEDFRKFQKGYTYEGVKYDNYQILLRDICNILHDLKELGIAIPEPLQNVSLEDFASKPEFFIMTLDNNIKQRNSNLPKRTMGAYLFAPNSRHFLEWGCKREAKENVMQRLGFDVLDARSPLSVTFIFSKMDISNLNIKDIIEDPTHEIIRPHL